MSEVKFPVTQSTGSNIKIGQVGPGKPQPQAGQVTNLPGAGSK